MKVLMTMCVLLVSMLCTESMRSQSLRIEAYVVYDNGKESKKNLLSNNPMEIDNAMLYNIDAGQTNPDDLEGVTSTKLKVVIRTQDVVDIVIKKGKKTAVDKKGQSISGAGTFYVDNIVCVPVGITVKKGNKVIGKKIVDFQCGE